MQPVFVCPGDAPGTAAPKNEPPKAPVRKPPSGKGPKRGVGYSLVGGVGRSWSSGLGMGPNFANGLRAPTGCPGTTTPNNERPNYPVPKPPSGKGPKRGVCYSLGAGVGLSWSAGLGMGPNFTSGLRVPAGCPGQSRAQKRAPQLPRPKTAQRKRAKTGGVLLPWWGGGAKLVRRTRNGAKLCERPPCARGMPRSQPRPKTSAPTTPSQNRPAEMAKTGGVL